MVTQILSFPMQCSALLVLDLALFSLECFSGTADLHWRVHVLQACSAAMQKWRQHVMICEIGSSHLPAWQRARGNAFGAAPASSDTSGGSVMG